MALRKILLSIGLAFSVLNIWAQVTVDFALPATACLNQTLVPTNNSNNATNYFWDFNQGDLLLTPTAQNTGSVGGSTTTGIDVVFDGTNWFGFVASRDNNTLIRLDYGTNLNNSPAQTVLSGFLANVRPADIKIVYAQGAWYGFVYGLEKLIVRLDFGTTLTNTSPTTEVIINDVGIGDGGIDVVADGTSYYLAYSKGSGVGIARLNTVTSIPTVAEKIFITLGAGSLTLGDIKLIKASNQWFAFVPSYFGAKQVVKLFFGSDPLSIPVESVLPVSALGSFSPYGAEVVRDNGNYMLFLVTVEGSVIRTNLGNDLTLAPVSSTNLGNFGNVVSNSLKVTMPKQGSNWFLFSVSWATGALYKLAFPNPPTVTNLATATLADPELIYTSPGTHHVSLTARSGGDVQEAHASVVVENKSAPTVNYTSVGVCLSGDVSFSPQTSEEITNFFWSFGDAQTSTSESPVHLYSTIGTYEVSLMVTATNGCLNKVAKELSVYNPPQVNFSIPTPTVACTNQIYIFNNTSTFDAGVTPNWQWLVDNVGQSTSQTGELSFSTPLMHSVKLVASIPGCSVEMDKTFQVSAVGPEVDFTSLGNCQNSEIIFSNNTTGNVASLLWDFGDGMTSTTQGAHTYSSAGTYSVILQATNAAGCQNFKTKSLTVYTKPAANFSLALPPFSCSGSASQFTDLTPSPTDSNITSWSWTFGDTQNNTAAIKNPTHVYVTAGDYSVSLNVATNFGCTSEITKTVTIAQTPTVDFTNTALCLNQPATFTPTATTDIKAWLWGMQNLTYTTQSPVHAFTTSGNQTVTMAATGNNNCVKSVTKNLSVPVPVVIGFSANSTCAGKPAEFTETSLTGIDPAVSWNWDFAGQASANTSTATHIFPATGNFNVRLNSTRQSGCTYSSTRSIAISQAPVSQFSVSTESGGAPLAVGFVNTSSGATSWLWNFNDAAQTTSTEFSPAFTYTQLGTYQAELIARNNLGCTDSFVKSIFVVEPQINVAVTNLLLIANNDGALATVTFENRSNVVVVNPEIILDLAGKAKIKERVFGTFLPGQQSSKSISTRIVSDNLGYICAEISVAGDVNSFDNRACSNLTGELTVVPPYPNPASEEVILEWIRGQRNQVEVKLYNAQGQVVLNKVHTNLSAGLNQLLIKVDALLPGLYFATVSDGDKTASYRVQVNR
jgi:PKD repeat protein